MAKLASEASVTVGYEELDGSPKETYTSSGFQATRYLQCDWTERHTLAKQLKGGRYYVGNDIITSKAAYYPWYPLAIVASVDIEGAGKPENQNSSELFEKAQLTVTYNVPTYNEETITEESVKPASEFLTLPIKGLYWGSGASKIPLKEADAPGLLIKMFDWNYTMKDVRNVPDWVKSLGGYVNSKTMKSDALKMTFEPETLLAGDPEMDRTVTTAGEKAWTIKYSFRYRNISWNRFPRTDAAGPNGIPFEPITNGTEEIKIFRLADFSSVLI